jgi:hypothetical protein
LTQQVEVAVVPGAGIRVGAEPRDRRINGRGRLLGEGGAGLREYYRPDDRFAPDTNSARIALAQDRAAEQLPADARG